MTKDLSLYIHIPFCKSKCLYCNFLSFVNKNEWVGSYIKTVCKEIKDRAKKFKYHKIETIYFGGGTPSLIKPEFIVKIIEQIKACFKVKRGVEITMECNPESVSEEKLNIYKSAGVNRFSIGVQSLKNKTLRRIGRPHNDRIVFKALDDFKKVGIKNFGCDFIIGLPHQTLQSFKKDVEKILKFKPKHLSFYFLSHDTLRINLFIKDCPDEDFQIRIYEWLCRKLKQNKYVHYEVSNWAISEFECKHNKRYWEQKDYLGIGLGAHSIIDGKIGENQSDLDAYIKNPMKTLNHMTIDPELKRMEYIMLRLRTNGGIDLKKYSELGDTKELLKNAKSYIRTKHLKKTESNLVATEKGFLLLETIIEALI